MKHESIFETFWTTLAVVRQRHQVQLETEPIPFGQRQMIRRYFESIRPTESDTK